MIFAKIRNFRWSPRFSLKSEIFFEIRNFRRNPRFSPKSEIFAEIRDFHRNLRFSPAAEIFADGWNLRRRPGFSNIFFQNFSKIYFFFENIIDTIHYIYRELTLRMAVLPYAQHFSPITKLLDNAWWSGSCAGRYSLSSLSSSSSLIVVGADRFRWSISISLIDFAELSKKRLLVTDIS